MAKNKYCTLFKQKVIADFSNGVQQHELSVKYNVEKSVISRWNSRYKVRGFVETKHNGGGPPKTSKTTDRRLVRFVKKNPFATARDVIKELELKVSKNTVRRRLDIAGLLCYIAAKKPFISEKNRQSRSEFAHAHKNWIVEQWSLILWGDESKFNLRHSDGKKHVRRPKCKRLNPSYTKAAFKQGGGKGVMIWGCFSSISGLGPLFQINGIMDRFVYRDILEKQMVPFADDSMPLRWQFQQDNDPKHTSKLIKNWFNTNQISLLKWPANSPDLNPIENLRKQLNDAIWLKGTISNADQLYIELKQAWQDIKIILK